MRKLFGVIISLGGWALTGLRLASDWIGRTTVLDDASLLGTRLKSVAAFVADQPAFGFYGVAAVMVLLGILLLLPRQWLESPGAKPSEILTPLEALSYLAARSKWGDKNRASHRATYRSGETGEWGPMPLRAAAQEFQRCAQQPETPVRAYGSLNGHGPVELIPHTFWMANTLDADGSLYGDDRTQSHPKRGLFGHSVSNVFYTHVRIESRGLEATWPPLGPIGRLVDQVRSWRDGDRYLEKEKEKEKEEVGDTPPSAPPPPVPQKAAPAPAAPVAKPHGLAFPYRKAVLQIGDIKSSLSKQGSLFTRADCHMDVRNETGVDLRECAVHILRMSSEDGVEEIDAPMHRDPFRVARNGFQRVIFVHRDLKDVVSRPPHLLKVSTGPRPLLEGRTYRIEIELRSEYEYPTLVTLVIEVSQDPEGAVAAAVESQKPDDRL